MLLCKTEDYIMWVRQYIQISSHGKVVAEIEFPVQVQVDLNRFMQSRKCRRIVPMGRSGGFGPFGGRFSPLAGHDVALVKEGTYILGQRIVERTY